PVEGDAVDVVSYAQDREEAPSIQEACQVLADRRDALILTCNVDFGSSGAPVFSIRDGKAEVVSVVSAKAEVNGQKFALAVPLSEPLAALRAALEASRVGSATGDTSVTVLSGGTGSGAKFVKP
ncbi:MAG: trypsin-like serine peptidase, partial [Tabrizicola sp.]